MANQAPLSNKSRRSPISTAPGIGDTARAEIARLQTTALGSSARDLARGLDALVENDLHSGALSAKPQCKERL